MRMRKFFLRDSHSSLLACRRMLEASIDPYNGVIINPKKLPNDEIAFGTALERSLERWRVEGRRGVWLTVPVDKAPFLPLALEV